MLDELPDMPEDEPLDPLEPDMPDDPLEPVLLEPEVPVEPLPELAIPALLPEEPLLPLAVPEPEPLAAVFRRGWLVARSRQCVVGDTLVELLAPGDDPLDDPDGDCATAATAPAAMKVVATSNVRRVVDIGSLLKAPSRCRAR